MASGSSLFLRQSRQCSRICMHARQDGSRSLSARVNEFFRQNASSHFVQIVLRSTVPAAVRDAPGVPERAPPRLAIPMGPMFVKMHGLRSARVSLRLSATPVGFRPTTWATLARHRPNVGDFGRTRPNVSVGQSWPKPGEELAYVDSHWYAHS